MCSGSTLGTAAGAGMACMWDGIWDLFGVEICIRDLFGVESEGQESSDAEATLSCPL